MFATLVTWFGAIKSALNVFGWFASRDLIKKGEEAAKGRAAKKGEDARRKMEDTKRPSSDDVAKRLRNGDA